MAEITEKTCEACMRALPLSDFRKHGQGFSKNCRSCLTPYKSQVGETKRCLLCGEVKLRSEFGFSSGVHGPLTRSYCRPCASVKSMAWRDRNADKARNAHLQRNYGITLDQYQEMLRQQNGLCAICGRLPGETRPDQGRAQGRPVRPLLAVDHDHATGKVRGLLCLPCNRGIGFLEDSIEIVRSALKYLENRN